MNVLVYLSELDSVNRSEKELECANTAFKKAIGEDCDSVVLTYNQLADSVYISKWIEDPDLRELFHKAVKEKRICISPFGGIRSCKEYIQKNAIEKSIRSIQENGNEEFVFSALPFINNCDSGKRLEIYEKMREAAITDNMGYLDELEAICGRDNVDKIKNYMRFISRLNLLLEQADYLPMQMGTYSLYQCYEELMRRLPEDSEYKNPVIKEFLCTHITPSAGGRSGVIEQLRASGLDDEAKKRIEEIINFCYNWQLQRNIQSSLENGTWSGSERLHSKKYDDPIEEFDALKERYKNCIHPYISLGQ